MTLMQGQRKVLSDADKMRMIAVFILCAGLWLAALLPALAGEFSILQIADENLVNREPVVSDSLVAWYAYVENPDQQANSQVFIYRNGKRENLTSDPKTSHAHPHVYKNTIVWEGQFAEVPLNADQPGEGTAGTTPSNAPPAAAAGAEPAAADTNVVTGTFGPEGGKQFQEHPGSSPWNILMSRDSGMVPLGPPAAVNGIAPRCGERLTVWQRAAPWPCGWEIMVWQEGAIRQITTNCFYDMSPQVYGDQVVWFGWDGQDYEIYLYKAGPNSIEQLTDNSYDDISPVIWDTMIAWEAYPAVDADIFIWKDGLSQKISDNTEDDTNPRIWNGQVVWQGLVEDDYEIFYYDGKKTIKLTSNDFDDLEPDIRDDMVCWVGYHNNWDAEIFVVEKIGERPVMLTDNDYEDRNPRTAARRVVWEAKRAGKPLIYLAEPKP